MQGVVFNAHWLTFFDEASTRWFEWLGFDPKETFTDGGAFDVMVVKAVLEWQGPAGFDADVAIAVAPVRIGDASFDVRFSATADGAPACVGTITYVSVVPGSKRSVPIPDVLRTKLEEHRRDGAAPNGERSP